LNSAKISIRKIKSEENIFEVQDDHKKKLKQVW